MQQQRPFNGQILYAEDNPFERDHFINLFKEMYPDSTLCTFENGLQLINHLINIKDPERFPKRIILDLFMPSWNGLQTLRALKENDLYHQIPVSIVTASSDENDLKMIKKLGASNCASKPLTEQTMSLLVDEIL